MRTIFCSDCGQKLQVPAAATPGRKVRCGRCEHVFAIPRPVSKDTSVRSYDIEELPPELQEAIHRKQPSDDKGPKFPTMEPTALNLPAEIDEDTAARRAFDLTDRNDPRRMTGAGVIDISRLDLAPAWLDEPPEEEPPEEEPED